MTFHPGGLLGLPPGVPAPLYDLGWWRDLLTVLALAAAWLELRHRRAAAVTAAVVMAVLALAFWIFALGRPYGLLVDPAITRWAADLSVAARAGGSDGFLVGEPGLQGLWAVLVRAGVAPGALLFLPTVLPLVVLLATAAAAAALAPRDEAGLAAIVWLGASTGALDTLRGFGLVTTLWPRPMAGIALLAAMAVVVLAHRLLPPRAALVASVAALLVAAAWAPAGPRIAVAEALWLATLDQWPWIVPAAWAFRRAPWPAARALLTGGGAALALALGRGGDAAWIANAAYRLGVVLLATHGLRVLADKLSAGGLVSPRVPARSGTAALVLVTLCGSMLVWWEPTRLDPVARASLDPVSPGALEAMAWLRENTPSAAVIVAGEDYAPSVAVLAGRRVLRAPTLAVAADEERRLRAQRALLAGRAVPDLVERYGLAYVLTAPGQFRDPGEPDAADLRGRAGLRLVYASPRGVEVYEIEGRGTRRVE
jgi:hypothetical protein